MKERKGKTAETSAEKSALKKRTGHKTAQAAQADKIGLREIYKAIVDGFQLQGEKLDVIAARLESIRKTLWRMSDVRNYRGKGEAQGDGGKTAEAQGDRRKTAEAQGDGGKTAEAQGDGGKTAEAQGDGGKTAEATSLDSYFFTCGNVMLGDARCIARDCGLSEQFVKETLGRWESAGWRTTDGKRIFAIDIKERLLSVACNVPLQFVKENIKPLRRGVWRTADGTSFWGGKLKEHLIRLWANEDDKDKYLKRGGA